jgi:hypothetical protein
VGGPCRDTAPITEAEKVRSTPPEDQGELVTADLWLVLILLAVAVSVAAHNHRLADTEPGVSDAPSKAEAATVSRH